MIPDHPIHQEIYLGLLNLGTLAAAWWWLHVEYVAFVGESRTGSLIQTQSAPTLKRLHFELGGEVGHGG